MKCIYCSHRLVRTDWFCPNCKRSVDPSRKARRTSALVYVTAVVLGLTAGGAVFSRLPRPGVTSATRLAAEAAPEVTFRELPPREPAPIAAAPAPAVEAASQPAPRPARPHRRSPAAPAVQPVASTNGSGPGALTVTTVPPVATFVYLNGGSLLGQTPIRNAAVPAGRQTLVFWTPSVGGRSRRTVDVAPGETTLVVEPVRTQAQFADSTGG